MAISGSGLYAATFTDILDATQLAVDLSLATHKFALFNNSLTAPNYTTDTAYGVAPYNANEVSGTGWAAGGVALSAAASGATSTTPTLTASSGLVTYDMANVAVSGTTLTAARGAQLYADALAGNNAILFLDFITDYSTVAGLFEMLFDAAGVFYLDCVP